MLSENRSFGLRDEVERDRTERDRTERDRTERDRTERDRTERDRTERDRTERDRTEMNRTERDRTERDRTEREGARTVAVGARHSTAVYTGRNSAMMGSKPPRMERGPFLGPDGGPFLEDFVEPFTLPTTRPPPEVITFLDFGVSFPTNDTEFFTNTTSNETSIIVEYDTYPSGYTWMQIILLAVIITSVMVVVVVGNMLVIIAIATEKSLKNITNWFIASLAVADLLLGLVIMPFSLANLLMGYWIFGNLWCELHSAIDVLLSTASINNICLISLDRYWSITHAVAYLKKRTPERSLIMIIFVWVFSGLVSIPPLLGWKKDALVQEFPKCEVGTCLPVVYLQNSGEYWSIHCLLSER
ncbi:G protein-coupled receptor rhodopsin-like [Trinorchestia longiramus]|nr:G protein-coupled receptor rhodopsin-like [Trinorchestia longiramus]